MDAVLPNLYISSWYHIVRPKVLENKGVTHVLSVLRDLDSSKRLKPFKRMIINVDDDPDESLIDYFEASAQWIDDAMAEGGIVCVHCLAGVSRSATIVAAYLMRRFKISVTEAMENINEVRSVNPNSGFREQLQVYLDCNYVANSSMAAYRHWRLRQDTRLQKGITGKYQKPDVILYAEPIANASVDSHTVDLRCKKCRRILATSNSFLIHKPPNTERKFSYAEVASTPRGQMDSVLSPECAHFFLEPQDWMQPTIDLQELDGKLECPKCSSKVGGYAWQGMKCSCGRWVTPSFSLAKSKVDEVRRVNIDPPNEIVKPPMGMVDDVKSKV